MNKEIKNINSEYQPGIRMLLSMKGGFEEGDQCEFDDEEFLEEITDEQYNKNVNEIDNLIRDMIRTKHKLRLGKLRTKIKTKEDLLNFMRIKDKNDNLIPPEPSNSSQSQQYLNNFHINQNSKSNDDFNLIKEKLMKQEENFKNKNIIEDKLDNSNKNNGSSFFLTHNTTTSYKSSDDDLNSIFDEIKKAENKCDDLLDDIDDCIKMGEDLDKIIDSTYSDA